MYYFITCRNGNINEIAVPIKGMLVSVMECFEREGYKWVNAVTGKANGVYTIERRSE